MSSVLHSLTLITLLLLFTTTTTTGHIYLKRNYIPLELIIPSLILENITSLHLRSPSPEIISLFSHSNISLLLSIPNSLIPSFSSNTSATSAWLSSHVTPFLPYVRISAISLGNNVMEDANLTKFLLHAIVNVKEKVKELGVGEIKVSTTVSMMFVERAESVAKPLVGYLSETNSSLFVNVHPSIIRDIPMGARPYMELLGGGYILKYDPSTHLRYDKLFNGEILDYDAYINIVHYHSIIETRVYKVMKGKVKIDGAALFMMFCFVFAYFYLMA